MVNWFEDIMNFFVAWFILITGLILLPQLLETSSFSTALAYSLSILLSAIYFMYQAVKEFIIEEKK